MTEIQPPNGSAFADRLNIAKAVAREAGQLALVFAADRSNLNIDTKEPHDFVTQADKEVELKIRTAIQQHFPEDGFIGEETGAAIAGSGYWVVDPIDGTMNFMKGLQYWGVSIAYVFDNIVRLGVIFDPPNNTLYHAERGVGAFRDGMPIRSSTLTDLNQAIAILGISRRTALDNHLNLIQQLFDVGIDYRRMGSAAIGLAQVAEGLAELYYEQHLNCWDALAGMLIAHEAGAVVMAPALADFKSNGGPVLAGTTTVIEKMSSPLLDGSITPFFGLAGRPSELGNVSCHGQSNPTPFS